MKFKFSANIIAIFALLILSVPALFDLTKSGFYTSHDGETHAARIAMYHQALVDGQFPPRFANTFYSGLGSPIFVYIYPLPYLFGALFHFAGFTIAGSFKILLEISFLLSGIFTYLWLKALFRSSKAAFAGALFYMWAPYRFLLIYVRASVSEMIAYTFVSLTFFTITKLVLEKKLLFFPLTSLAITGILLSQNLVALLTLPIIGVYALLLSISSKSAKSLIYCFFAAALGIAGSAVTYLPSFLEREFIHFDSTITNAFVNHFASFGQLIRSPWGYGFDLPGTINDQISLQIGIAQLLILAVFIGLCLYFSAKKIFGFQLNFIAHIRIDEFIICVFFLLVAVISIFLMVETAPTVKIWQNFKPIAIIDIPWRLLGIVILAIAPITALVTRAIKPGIFFIVIITLVIFANRNHLRINQIRELSDSFLQSYTGTATQYNEFTPHWRVTEKVPEHFNLYQKAQFVEGKGTMKVLENNSKTLKIETNITSGSAKLLIHKFYFPGSILKVDSKTKDLGAGYEISNSGAEYQNTQQDQSGLPRLTLLGGKHQVDFSYAETKLRVLANLVSLGSLLTIFLLLIIYAKKHT